MATKLDEILGIQTSRDEELTPATAENRIRRFSKGQNMDPDQMVATWKKLGSPTGTHAIKSMFRSNGGKNLGYLKKAKIGYQDSNVSDTAKTLLSYINQHGLGDQVLKIIKDTGLQKGGIAKFFDYFKTESVERVAFGSLLTEVSDLNEAARNRAMVRVINKNIHSTYLDERVGLGAMTLSDYVSVSNFMTRAGVTMQDIGVEPTIVKESVYLTFSEKKSK